MTSSFKKLDLCGNERFMSNLNCRQQQQKLVRFLLLIRALVHALAKFVFSFGPNPVNV